MTQKKKSKLGANFKKGLLMGALALGVAGGVQGKDIIDWGDDTYLENNSYIQNTSTLWSRGEDIDGQVTLVNDVNGNAQLDEGDYVYADNTVVKNGQAVRKARLWKVNGIDTEKRGDNAVKKEDIKQIDKVIEATDGVESADIIKNGQDADLSNNGYEKITDTLWTRVDADGKFNVVNDANMNGKLDAGDYAYVDNSVMGEDGQVSRSARLWRVNGLYPEKKGNDAIIKELIKNADQMVR